MLVEAENVGSLPLPLPPSVHPLLHCPYTRLQYHDIIMDYCPPVISTTDAIDMALRWTTNIE